MGICACPWDGGTGFSFMVLVSGTVRRVDCAFRVTQPVVAELADAAFAPQGMVHSFSAAETIDSGFVYYPSGVQAYDLAIGGSLPAGTYMISVAFKYTDAHGRKWYSALSSPNTVVTSGATSRIYLSIPLLGASMTQKGIVDVLVFCTQKNGTVLYLVDTYRNDPADVGPSFFGEVNPYWGHFVEITTEPDGSEEQPYVTGGVLDNVMPADGLVIAEHGDRLWVAEGTTLWPSKQVQDERGVEFNEGLRVLVPQAGGDITAVAGLQGQLFVFKKERIYYLYGDGPNDIGVGSFSSPMLITDAVGAQDQRSVGVESGRIFFWSSKGAWVLSSGGELSYLGLPVESFNSRICVRCLSVPLQNQVRFYLNDGNVLVFDYVLNTWAVYTNGGAFAGLLEGAPTVATTAGNLYVEDNSEHFDNLEPITMLAELGWLKVGGLAGYQRLQWLYVLGDFAVRQRIKVELMYDYDDTVVQTIIWERTREQEPAEVRIKPWQQKCQAVKIRVSNDGIQNRTAPISFDAVRLHVGILPKKALRASATR